jgi:basic membrane lipoprotein Med (substrate-binding protein (PBP1-ABC) superfamily)
MIDRGADVMYAERFGVSDAAKEKGVKVIGNVIDTSAQYPGTVLASALWHMEPSIDRAIKAVTGGTFEAIDYGPFSFMSEGGASLVIDEKLVPADVVKLVKDKETEIKDGMFRVNINDAEPKSS